MENYPKVTQKVGYGPNMQLVLPPKVVYHPVCHTSVKCPFFFHTPPPHSLYYVIVGGKIGEEKIECNGVGQKLQPTTPQIKTSVSPIYGVIFTKAK